MRRIIRTKDWATVWREPSIDRAASTIASAIDYPVGSIKSLVGAVEIAVDRSRTAMEALIGALLHLVNALADLVADSADLADSAQLGSSGRHADKRK